MLRRVVVGIVALALVGGAVWAQGKDKDVRGTLVKVDAKNKTLTVKTSAGDRTYDVNDDTRFVGPKGGAADAGLMDERLVPGVMLRLVVAANNRTAREVHIPEAKRKKGKDR